MFKKRPFILTALFLSFLNIFYWSFIASNQYVSESKIIVQKTDLSSQNTPDITGLLTGQQGINKGDQLLLRDYLLSKDMLKKIDKELDLKEHYSDSKYDFISRLWFKESSIEWLHRFYLKQISVEYDEYSGVLIINTKAFYPEKAFYITSFLVKEGENFMNKMAQSLAKDQVLFLEEQVQRMKEKTFFSRNKVLEYQDNKNMLSPKISAESFVAIINGLESEKTNLETQKSALSTYLVPNHASIVQLEQKITSIEKQIQKEQSKLTSLDKNRSLNKNIEEFQRLESEAKFDLEMYQSAISALEKGRLEAMRNIKKLSIIQEPILPEYSMEPRRIYNSIVGVLIIFIFTGFLNMILAIIKDHKD